ncbi:E3 ubiquitin-protein ligase NHLRC1-like [Trichomycterus rosablanca]|uniref:E3 ubiquitin-protein ligase NHLRC1-like n=1 Tax=Trichomycterus rosablanca TaxID=2290929 RepID=UPI002F358065
MRKARGAEEILEEIRSDLLECKVCFEQFIFDRRSQRPRNLPCGHLICLSCVCALSHPVSRHLECPFCRTPCEEGGTYECQALVDLNDLVGSYFLQPEGRVPAWQQGSGSGVMRLCRTFGGWDWIVNPTGVAVSGSEVLVVHGGSEKGAGFERHGKFLRTFGREICYPLDVAVAPSGHVVVTDAGDCSVKVFSPVRHLVATISGLFELPWGVDMDSSGHILVTDASSGTVWQLMMDFQRSVVLVKRVVVRDLHHPRAVSCCRSSGHVLIVEHLGNQPKNDELLTRLNLFSKDLVLLKQLDTFSLDLTTSVRLSISAVAFDKKGDLIVADADHGIIWSLGDLQEMPVLIPLIKEGLLRPVGLAMTEENVLIVLDGEDHAIKMYCSQPVTT